MNDHPITLKELLRLSFAGSLDWISPPSSGNIFVQWVVLSVENITEGDVLLIRGGQLDPEVVDQTWKKGGAAVITVGDSSLAASEFQAELPLVAISSTTDIREAFRIMLTILINQRAHLMERGVRIHGKLSQVAALGEGLFGLTRTMYDLSGRGVIVQDKRLEILAEFPSSTMQTIWDDVLGQLLEKENLPKELRDRKEAGKRATIRKQTLPGDIERIITPISVGGVARGYLSLVDLVGTLDSLDYLVVEQGALVCAVEMARAKAVREAEKRLKGSLLTALLLESITPRDANLWVQGMDLDLDQAHVAMRFAWDAPASIPAPSMRRLETLVNGEVSSKGYRVIVETIDVEVVCIIELEPVQGRPELAIDFANTVLQRALEEYPDIPARCGVGSVSTEIGDWRVSFQQAGQALEMSRRLSEDQPLYYPDLSVYRLLMQLEYHPELSAFKNRILGPLLSQDGGGEFLHTLEVYFDFNGNLTQAAEALFIHRNTLTYRLDRISEICAIDLNNNETRLAVQLALRIHKMTASRE